MNLEQVSTQELKLTIIDSKASLKIMKEELVCHKVANKNMRESLQQEKELAKIYIKDIKEIK